MFGKFKEKLKEWFKSSSEKIEERVEDKDIIRAEKIIEESKEEKNHETPIKFDENRLTVPDLDKVKDEAEKIKSEVNQAKKKQKEIKNFDEELSRVKKEFYPQEKIEEKKESIFSRIKSSFSYKIKEEDFNNIFEDLESLLLENNVALEAVDKIKQSLIERLIGKEIKKDNLENEIKNELRFAISEILIEPDNPLDFIKLAKKPFKILFFGINGVGKTTSIAKVANFLKKAGFSVVLAAGDTFRAASIEQIEVHAKNLKIPLIKQDYGADSASVGYDAIKYAEKHNIDVVLIDSAGRMHTKTNLLAEMKKIVKVTDPDLKLFVAESISGNDAVEQAKTFHETINIDGSVLSKADIDDKGGTVISLSYATKKPVFYLGTGQNYDDLELFNKQRFINSLGL
ncbi:MAG: signal recognition particle-docking protein FtsY [Nanoarchaeota archaeon]